MGARRVGDLACTEHLRDGRMRFYRDYELEVDWSGGLLRITVPKGMLTDGSSVPRLFRWLLPKDRTRQAGFIHDRLYADPQARAQRSPSWDDEQPGERVRLTKGQCDRLWGSVANAGTRRASLPLSLCWLGVLALWLFGWLAWNRHRRLANALDAASLSADTKGLNDAGRLPMARNDKRRATQPLASANGEKRLGREVAVAVASSLITSLVLVGGQLTFGFVQTKLEEDQLKTVVRDLAENHELQQRIAALLPVGEAATYVITGDTNGAGGFEIPIPKYVDPSRVVGITTAIKNDDGNWHTIYDPDGVANEFFWNAESGVVKGFIQHGHFHARPVRVTLLVWKPGSTD